MSAIHRRKRVRPLDLEMVSGDPDVVLYWLLSDVTSEMALKFELHNRRQDEDFRLQYLAEQERLLRVLRADWADAFAERIRDILKAHPFNDPGESG